MIVVAIDADDPSAALYHRAMPFTGRFGAGVTVVTLPIEDTGDLVRATNTVALRIAREDPDAIIGNLGDDHVCRTEGWDRRIAEALREPGIAYGDDLLQHEKLPTAPFVSASIVNALGWYFLPTLRHMFVDDALLAIGTMLGRLTYIPEVVIEHVHPGAGKAETDAGYERADASTEADRAAFRTWLEDGITDDLNRVIGFEAVA
jgi:hypothetical protein